MSKLCLVLNFFRNELNKWEKMGAGKNGNTLQK